jgi:hypothetical protein
MARGRFERSGGRIVSDRVLAHALGRASLFVALVDEHGAEFDGPARFTLRGTADGTRRAVEREARVAGWSKLQFERLEPGHFVLEGRSPTEVFGPRVVRLEPLEVARVELAGQPGEAGTCSLSIELRTQAGHAVERSALPESLRLLESVGYLRRSMSGSVRAFEPARGLGPADLSLRWSGFGADWRASARIDGLRRGMYRLGVDPLRPDPGKLRRALDAMGLEGGEGQPLGVAAAALELELLLVEDTQRELELPVIATELLELDLRWDAERGELEAQVDPALLKLGAWTRFAEAREPGRLRGVYARAEDDARTLILGSGGRYFELLERAPPRRPEPGRRAVEFELAPKHFR